jgi:hypothetical protein
MRRSKIIFGILGLSLSGLLAVVFWPEKPGPVYNGRKLSEWVRVLGERARGTDSDLGTDAEGAVLAIGTNGTPFYLKCVAYERHGFSKAISPLLNRWFRKSYLERPEDLRQGAIAAFYTLGEKAEAAIPGLEECVTNSKSFVVRTAGLRSLAGLGDRGAVAYARVMTNANSAIRMQSVSYSFLVTNPVVSAQRIKLLQDQDPVVRSAATNCLNYIARRLNRATSSR